MVGLNCQLTVWKVNYLGDDTVGGASPVYTITQRGVDARLEDDAVTQQFLEQGMETPRLVTAIVVPQNLAINEGDEVEVTSPVEHQYYQKHLKVLSIQRDSISPHDHRGHLELKLSRIMSSRGTPWPGL